MLYCSNSQQASQTYPLCPQVHSALHILSGCQHTQLRNMITERHNLACRMIFKTISKTGSLGSCIVSKEIGSNERVTMQISRFLKQLKGELFPNRSSHPASQIKTDVPPAAQICAGYSNLCKTRKQQTAAGGWVLRSGRGQLRDTGSIPAALPATSRATNPKQHRPKDLSKTRRDIHLVEIKYCEDT